MNLQRDSAQVLNIVMPSIEAATRRFVYVAGYKIDGVPPTIEREWLKYGGETDFVYENADPNKVGIVIFQLVAPPYVTSQLAERLRPFYAKAGTEANVFEFDPIMKMFTRRDPEWLEFPGRVQ